MNKRILTFALAVLAVALGAQAFVQAFLVTDKPAPQYKPATALKPARAHGIIGGLSSGSN